MFLCLNVRYPESDNGIGVCRSALNLAAHTPVFKGE